MSSSGGSYKFKQVAPASTISNQYGAKYKNEKITRTVTISGSGESA